jgi:hypothetical protein
MTVTVQAYDGTRHDFPDGTDPAVIKKSMDDYRAKQPAAAAGAPAKPMLSPLDRVGTGALDPVLGTAQLGAHVADAAAYYGSFGNYDPGLSGPFDEWMRQREAEIEARSPKPKPRGYPRGAESDPGSYDVPGNSPLLAVDNYRLLGNMGTTAAETAVLPAARALGVIEPAEKTLAVPSFLRRLSTGSGQGAAFALQQPATHGGSYTGEKIEQGVAGAVAGSILPIGEAGIRGGARMIRDWYERLTGKPEDRAFTKAVQMIYKRMTDDVQGGGATAQDMLDLLKLTPETPLTIGHAGGENVLNLIGRVMRQPGASRQKVTQWLKDTDAGATGRISGQMDKALATDGISPSQAVKGLQQARTANSKDLWDDAMAGGSIAPLKQQFQDAYVDTGREEKDLQGVVADWQRQILQATAKQQRAGNDVYLVNSANSDLRKAQAGLQQAQHQLQHISEVRQQILGMVQHAQADIDANTPGAVWSPRLQQFLDQPEIKSGLQTGYKMARQKAVTNGVPINAREYAITGFDENGDAIVGRVPTMRLLAAAKTGLDAELDKPIYHDELTGSLNQAGVHLDGMRRAFVEELDRLNPAYKTARAVWSGDTASMQAVRYGEKQWTNKRPEEIADDIAKMAPGDVEFARLGLAANLRKRMYQMGGSGNEARAVAGDKSDSWLRQQIRPFFRTDEEFKAFTDSVDAENLLFTKKFELKGGSHTAGRLAEDTSSADADRAAHRVGGLAAAASHHWLPATYHFLKSQTQPRIPESVANEIANIVSSPEKSLEVIGGYKPPAGPTQRIAPYLTGPAAALTAQELGLE